MFSANLTEHEIEQLSVINKIDDKYHINKREVYLLFSSSIRNSKLAKLSSPSTIRNWKTINKLIELANKVTE